MCMDKWAYLQAAMEDWLVGMENTLYDIEWLVVALQWRIESMSKRRSMPSILLKRRLSACCTLSADRAREGSFNPAAIGRAWTRIREQSARPPWGRGHSATPPRTRPRSSQRRVKWLLCPPTSAPVSWPFDDDGHYDTNFPSNPYP